MTAGDARPATGTPSTIMAELEAKGIEYKSPEYWAHLQDRAGKK